MVAEDAEVLQAAPDQPVVEHLVVAAVGGAGGVPALVGAFQVRQGSVELEVELGVLLARDREDVDHDHEGLLRLELDLEAGYSRG